MPLYIGLMSGTSMDGIDAALVDIDTHQLLSGITRPYTPHTQRFLDEVIHAKHIPIPKLSQLNTLLGREFAEAVFDVLNQGGCSSREVVAIGSHGQTIAHDAQASVPYTIQLGCPHTIAQHTGIQVVADFRARDLVVGGQGAPFAPLYHQALFSKQSSPLAVINIGGISNVTFLENGKILSGFDMGPGNCLMDAWIKKILGESYDSQGNWASSGKVINRLLDDLLMDPFFQQPSPKSIGKEYFSLEGVTSKFLPEDRPEDIQATFLELTATSISSVILHSNLKLQQVILCGGGVHNIALKQAIQKHLGNIKVESSMMYNIDPNYIEAMMFAWLAEKTIHRKPLDLSPLTGSQCPIILGCIYPGAVN